MTQLSLLTLPVDEFNHIARFAGAPGLARLAATCKAIWHGWPMSLGLPAERESLFAEGLLQGILSRSGVVPKQLPPTWGGWVPYLLRRLGRYEDQRVRSVAAGLGPHSVIAGENGELLVCGSERECPGLLGGAANGMQVSTLASRGVVPDVQPDIEDDEEVATHTVLSRPSRVAGLEGTRVVEVAADFQGQYTLALDTSGEVYSWGGGRAAAKGALGHGDTVARAVPTRVEALSGKGVCGISASYACSLAWTKKGSLFIWGQVFNYAPRPPFNCSMRVFSAYINCCFGELRSPTLVRELQGKPVRSAAAGHLLALAVLQSGQLYSWGSSSSFHGHGDIPSGVGVPSQVAALSHVQVCEVVTGEGSVMALTEDGQVYSWGRNLGHCLGHSPEGSGSEKAQPILLPKRVEALAGARVRSVELTSTAGFAVLDEGQLYSWGSELSQCDVLGGHAGLELPCGRLSPCVVPRRVEALQGTRMRRVVATRQHALGVSADGAVFSWGVFGFYAWGYFGYALGLGKDPLHFSHSANRRRMAHQAPTQIEGVRVRV